MKLADCPEIGSKVTYIRQNKDGGILTGDAHMLAVHMDTRQRLMAHLKNDTETFNVDLKCVNPSDQFKAEYEAATLAVQDVSSEANAAAAKIITDANQRIDELYTAVLGAPVEFQ